MLQYINNNNDNSSPNRSSNSTPTPMDVLLYLSRSCAIVRNRWPSQCPSQKNEQKNETRGEEIVLHKYINVGVEAPESMYVTYHTYNMIRKKRWALRTSCEHLLPFYPFLTTRRRQSLTCIFCRMTSLNSCSVDKSSRPRFASMVPTDWDCCHRQVQDGRQRQSR